MYVAIYSHMYVAIYSHMYIAIYSQLQLHGLYKLAYVDGPAQYILCTAYTRVSYKSTRLLTCTPHSIMQDVDSTSKSKTRPLLFGLEQIWLPKMVQVKRSTQTIFDPGLTVLLTLRELYGACEYL